MKELYSIANISKQALWKHDRRQETVTAITGQMVDIMEDIRQRHKRMGCRRMYYATQGTLPVGRDLFEKIGFANGFKLRRKPNTIKTTWGQRVEVHPNLIEGKILSDINQVWQSDIFYIKIEGKDYYGVSIEDVYSRKMLSIHISKSLQAEQVEIALKKAIKARKNMDLTGCIFHSDRGSQYISTRVKKLLRDNQMQISMCKMPQENAYVERVQGTLKYEYLYEFDLTEKNLPNMIRKILEYYNKERPHSNLKMNNPERFELEVEKLVEKQRPKLQIYKWTHGLSTKEDDINKKEKSSKKEKMNTIKTNSI